MLVLTLKDGESVFIGDNIRTEMDRCIDDGCSTRLRIEAPKDVIVLREELLKEDVR
jgi:carbon storage regulator CsrA